MGVASAFSLHGSIEVISWGSRHKQNGDWHGTKTCCNVLQFLKQKQKINKSG